MNNLSRFLRVSRNALSKGLLYGKDGNLSEGLALRAYTARAGFSTTGQNISPKGKSGGFLVSYTVYKGKAALSIAPVLPTFTKLDSGFHVINRMGSVLLKFVPAIGERKYDWEKKQMFGLNPTEIGSLISMGSTDSCEFFHDPSMKSSNAGQVRKSLSIKPHTTGGGYMISLTVVNNILKTRDNISVPFTTAEFAVMKTSCNYALPHILGWDQLTMKSGSSLAYSSPKVDRQLLETEWDK